MFGQYTTDVTSLASGITAALAGLAVITTGAMVGWHSWMRSLSTDEMTGLQHSRSIRTTLIYGGLTAVAGGLASAILSYVK